MRKNRIYVNHIMPRVLFFLINQGCAPFSELPAVQASENIEGIYFNDNPADTTWKKRSLWSLIDYKSEIEEDSLLVSFRKTDDEMLSAYLMVKDSILVEHKIKGKFKDDGCYYSRRQVFIIPILPILWGYSNYQKRIYSIEGALVFEVTSNSGGVAIFMAGGDKYNDIHEYKAFKK